MQSTSILLLLHNLKHAPRAKTLFVYHTCILVEYFSSRGSCVFALLFLRLSAAVSAAVRWKSIYIKRSQRVELDSAVCNRTRLIEWNMTPHREVSFFFACSLRQCSFDELRNGKMRGQGLWGNCETTFCCSARSLLPIGSTCTWLHFYCLSSFIVFKQIVFSSCWSCFKNSRL